MMELDEIVVKESPGLCRCCLSEGCYKDLGTEYSWMNDTEIYADMLLECFDISISQHNEGPNGPNRLICEVCITRLRDACNFKKQVVESEKKFVDMIGRGEFRPKVVIYQQAPMKTEKVVQETMGDDIEVEYLDEDIDFEDDLPLSETITHAPSVSDDVTVSSLKLKTKRGRPKKTSTVKTEKKAKTAKLEDKPRTSKAVTKGTSTKKSTAKTSTKRIIEKRNALERDLDSKSEMNLKTVIQYSYVCPFKNRSSNYYCFYCKDFYPKPEDLREHTLSHDTKTYRLQGYKKMPKLDITRIDCKLCPVKIDDLTVFKQHVDQVHGKKIYFEAPDYMLLYRLTWKNLVCVLCAEVFEDFKKLHRHMVNTHFSNYTCDVCGSGFLDKAGLEAHQKKHNEDEKHTCEVCGKVFKSKQYKDMHVEIVHNKNAIIPCPRCDQSFLSYAAKNKHLIEAHGQKRSYPCNLCDNVYNRQKTLLEHQRRNHQKVLKHKCEYCAQRFYLPSNLKEHMATHTGERNFKCEYCDKSYPGLKSLRYHKRTHSNDPRYKCRICGQGFIQSTGLKSHIKSQHLEINSQ